MRGRARGPLLISRETNSAAAVHRTAHRLAGRSLPSPLAGAATIRRALDSDLIATAAAEAARQLTEPSPPSAAAQRRWGNLGEGRLTLSRS